MEPVDHGSISDPDILVEHLIDSGEKPPETLLDRIRALGEVCVPRLIALVQDDELALMDARGDGHGPLHAAKLLGELKASSAVTPLIKRLQELHLDDILFSRVLTALIAIGPEVAEPILQELEHVPTESDARNGFLDVLAACGAHDKRILRHLLDLLETNPELGGCLLGIYRDPSALPRLHKALDAWNGDPADWYGSQVVIEFAGAIKDLGGALTEEQEAKLAEVLSFRRKRRGKALPGEVDAELEEEPARRTSPKVGRNDPCPCGSGKKYKKCHGA